MSMDLLSFEHPSVLLFVLKKPVPVQELQSSDEVDLNNSSNLDDTSQTPETLESSNTENEPEPQVHGTEQEVQDSE